MKRLVVFVILFFQIVSIVANSLETQYFKNIQVLEQFELAIKKRDPKFLNKISLDDFEKLLKFNSDLLNRESTFVKNKSLIKNNLELSFYYYGFQIVPALLGGLKNKEESIRLSIYKLLRFDFYCPIEGCAAYSILIDSKNQSKLKLIRQAISSVKKAGSSEYQYIQDHLLPEYSPTVNECIYIKDSRCLSKMSPFKFASSNLVNLEKYTNLNYQCIVEHCTVSEDYHKQIIELYLNAILDTNGNIETQKLIGYELRFHQKQGPFNIFTELERKKILERLLKASKDKKYKNQSEIMNELILFYSQNQYDTK